MLQFQHHGDTALTILTVPIPDSGKEIGMAGLEPVRIPGLTVNTGLPESLCLWRYRMECGHVVFEKGGSL